MSDKDTQKVQFNREKTHESATSIAYDNKCRQEDMEKFINKHVYLQQYRNQNKQVYIYKCVRSFRHVKLLSTNAIEIANRVVQSNATSFLSVRSNLCVQFRFNH